MGVGAVFGGLLAGPVLSALDEPRVVAAGLVSFGVGAGLSAGPPIAIYAGASLLGFGAPLLVIGALTLLQRVTTNDLQGRAFSAFELLTTTPQIVSVA
jgi:hypothetical protein